MLESIEIKNFKRIGPDGLKLNNLAKVNYLVGKNGSGKSSVLEGFFAVGSIIGTSDEYNYEVENTLRPPFEVFYLDYLPQLSNNNIYSSFAFFKNNINYIANLSLTNIGSPRCLVRLSKESNFTESLTVLYRTADLSTNKYKKLINNSNGNKQIVSKESIHELKNLELPITKFIILQELLLKYNIEVPTGLVSPGNTSGDIRPFGRQYNGYDGNDAKIRSSSSGVLSICELFISIFEVLIDNLSEEIWLIIEEPDIHLNPYIQKLLPLIVKDFIDMVNINFKVSIQFFISTHSPFIISAAGKIAEQEVKDGKSITQKVYMIEDGICLNPEGSSGKDVKGIAATMLGAGIEDLTPSTVVFCAQSEKEFLERVNTKWYFKDTLFRTPTKDGGDGSLLYIAKIEHLNNLKDDFYPGSEIFYYRDALSSSEVNNFNSKLNKLPELKDKIILSKQTSFEEKFKQDPFEIKKQAGGKIQNAKNHAERLINMGESGKAEFEGLFGELGALFGFFEPKK